MPPPMARLRILRSLLFGYPNMQLDRLDYDDYWDHRKPSAVQPRYHLIADIVEPHSSVLDLGCGDGALLAYLAEAKHVQAVGVDVSQKAVERARSRGVQAYVADITEEGYRPQQVYDYVLLSEVLEHLEDPEDLLLRLKGFVRRGLLVSVPNIGFWPYRLRLLLGRFPVQWALHPGEHLRYWSVADFVWWSRALGYEVDAVVGTNGSNPLGLKLFKSLPGLFGLQILYCLRAPAGAATTGDSGPRLNGTNPPGQDSVVVDDSPRAE